MQNQVILSVNTKTIIAKLTDVTPESLSTNTEYLTQEELIILLEWTNTHQSVTNEELSAALLNDLKDYYYQKKNETTQVINADVLQQWIIANNEDIAFREALSFNESRRTSAQSSKEDEGKKTITAFIGLIIALFITISCEGFDSIGTFLLSIPTVPIVAVLVVGAVFSGIAIALFFSYVTIKAAEKWGLRDQNNTELIDIYQTELETMDEIIHILPVTDASQLNLHNTLAKMLQNKLNVFKSSCQLLQKAGQGKFLNAVLLLCSLLAGAIFFGGYYGAALTVCYVITTLLAATAIWPTILFASIVGAAAFYIFWCTGRVKLESFIGNALFKINKEKIAHVCESIEAAQGTVDELQGKLINFKARLRHEQLNTPSAGTERSSAAITAGLVQYRPTLNPLIPIRRCNSLPTFFSDVETLFEDNELNGCTNRPF